MENKSAEHTGCYGSDWIGVAHHLIHAAFWGFIVVLTLNAAGCIKW